MINRFLNENGVPTLPTYPKNRLQSNNRLQFSDALEFGQFGENCISQWLVQTLGYNVLPVYEKEGGDFKGPRYFTPSREIVAPDILAIKGSRVLWVEAKHKTVFSWHRITEQWVTGIDVRHYNDYLEISRIHPFPVWLLFLHSQSETREGNGHSPVGLFGQSLTYLEKNENHRSDKWGNSGMVYWSHATLRQFASIKRVGAAIQIQPCDLSTLSATEENEELDAVLSGDYAQAQSTDHADDDTADDYEARASPWDE